MSGGRRRSSTTVSSDSPPSGCCRSISGCADRISSLVAPTGTIPADQLTYNIILLGGLFAMRWRSVAAFLTSLFVVAVTHVLSLAVSVESAYARVGAWSERHYSSLEQDIWVSTEFWWRLVGMFAIVFVCWWLTQAPEQGRRREPRRRPASRSSLPS
ncbi:MAG: hypothetical protein DMF58_09215 [Acidobacteria bacterium]|nr:MAG: hypothetical protein DMF58_09215 [Acidobacteriota bacterium]